MNKNTIFAVIFLWAFLAGGNVAAKDDAVASSNVFERAEKLQKEHKNAKDAELVQALFVLEEWVVEGKRHLLNRKVKAAVRTAELVTVQMEYVAVLVELMKAKRNLEALQDETSQLAKKKKSLQSQYRQLTLQADGRALTGAYPAHDVPQEGDE